MVGNGLIFLEFIFVDIPYLWISNFKICSWQSTKSAKQLHTKHLILRMTVFHLLLMITCGVTLACFYSNAHS